MSRHTPKLYTQDEVAQLLAVSPSTVRWWRNQGKLAYIKIGRHVRITDLDLEDFLARNSISAKAADTRAKASQAQASKARP